MVSVAFQFRSKFIRVWVVEKSMKKNMKTFRGSSRIASRGSWLSYKDLTFSIEKHYIRHLCWLLATPRGEFAFAVLQIFRA